MIKLFIDISCSGHLCVALERDLSGGRSDAQKRLQRLKPIRRRKIDGKLDDPCWQKGRHGTGDFISI